MAAPDKLRADILARLNHITKDLSLFTSPTVDQRTAKSRFWAPFMSGDVGVPANIDLATALKFASDSRIKQWWSLPGFVDWFTNQEEFKERVEFIAHLALDGIEAVLKDPMATGGAKVAAAKLALEVANKLPKASKDDGEFADKMINKMSKTELTDYISQKVGLVNLNKKDLTIDLDTVNVNKNDT